MLIHHLPSQRTQSPFKRTKGHVQCVRFHPIKPYLFVATRTSVRLYDLASQELLKRIRPEAKWISSMSIHPLGENVLLGSYDKIAMWYDLELTSKPIQVLRHHTKAIRDVQYHRHLPLFSTVGDDSTIGIFHGSVDTVGFADATIVPLRYLGGLKRSNGHAIRKNLGVLSSAWHPRLPFLLTTGADGQGILWT